MRDMAVDDQSSLAGGSLQNRNAEDEVFGAN